MWLTARMKGPLVVIRKADLQTWSLRRQAWFHLFGSTQGHSASIERLFALQLTSCNLKTVLKNQMKSFNPNSMHHFYNISKNSFAFQFSFKGRSFSCFSVFFFAENSKVHVANFPKMWNLRKLIHVEFHRLWNQMFTLSNITKFDLKPNSQTFISENISILAAFQELISKTLCFSTDENFFL